MPASQTAPPLTRRRRPWILWVSALLFVAAAVSVPMATRFRRQAKTPKGLTELAERLKVTHPDWHIVKATGQADGLESGFWVCEQEVPIDQLCCLACRVEDGPEWEHVVLCRKKSAPHLNDWGDYGVVLDGIELFGDPDMLPRIVAYFRPER
ncbi:MAG TPA: hypothetical protein VH575_21710 [Gemmataceae bacterium]|jgi:hypothetical protein